MTVIWAVPIVRVLVIFVLPFAYAANLRPGIVGRNRIDCISTKGGMRGTKPDRHALIYRIHVKMKPVYIQSYGRGVRPIVKADYIKNGLNKLNWMG